MWSNDAEVNGTPGVDDDGNGYIDDVRGYNFVRDNNDPMDGNLHGTHVAGTVGATGDNNNGVVGVVWKTQLMALKGLADSGSGSLDALLETIYYAADNGARIVNCSWGGRGSPNSASRDAIAYALSKGTLPVLAAGNDTMNASGFSPAGISSALTVGASTPSDGLATFSNFGNVVDVIAPGTDILSTANGGGYRSIQGTSMAAPQVAGLAALILSINPNLDVQDLMQMIIDTGDEVDVVASDRDRSEFTYPRINAYKAALAARDSLGSNPNPSPTPPPECTDNCDGSVGEQEVVRGVANFNSNGCSYSADAASGMPLWFLFIPFALLIFRRRK